MRRFADCIHPADLRRTAAAEPDCMCRSADSTPPAGSDCLRRAAEAEPDCRSWSADSTPPAGSDCLRRAAEAEPDCRSWSADCLRRAVAELADSQDPRAVRTAEGRAFPDARSAWSAETPARFVQVLPWSLWSGLRRRTCWPPSLLSYRETEACAPASR